MPVLIIGVVFLVLFLIMGVMSLSAVASEHRFQREVDEYKRATGIPTNRTNETVGLNSVVAGR
jgi:Na+-transporting methylmalonyl-CoA/oxaloacetate decarboxylase gamma subunit